MKITIIGGGNIGTLMAAEAAAKGHEVTMFTSRPGDWNKEIQIYNNAEELLRTGFLSGITDSLEEALEAADYVLVTLPAQLFSVFADKMLPLVNKGQKIGIIPGSGGAEFAFRHLIEKGCVLFGLQRVHSIARLRQYGKSVYELGRKPEMHIGAIPASDTADICRVMEEIFDMPCRALGNYLSVTLTPSNPILHTTRLYSMFKDYKTGDAYPEQILFYEEWTAGASEMLLACDAELQKLCRAIPLDLSSVVSLADYYESRTADAMTEKIRGIKAFKGLVSPMKKVNDAWIPDWNSRYFTADFPFGLKIMKDIAGIFHVETPNIDMVWDWYEDAAMEDGTEVFNVDLTADEFLNLYK